MIIAYRAADIADAHLIRQLLEGEGIPAFIQGEYLQGAVGELPANTEILVHVSDEQFDAARAVVAEWESGEPIAFEADDEPPSSPPWVGVRVAVLVPLLAMVAICAVAMTILVRHVSQG